MSLSLAYEQLKNGHCPLDGVKPILVSDSIGADGFRIWINKFNKLAETNYKIGFACAHKCGTIWLSEDGIKWSKIANWTLLFKPPGKLVFNLNTAGQNPS